jgi:hypothetical protein
MSYYVSQNEKPVMHEMGNIKSEIEKTENYKNISCDNSEPTKLYCNNIKEITGNNPTFFSNNNGRYCFQVKVDPWYKSNQYLCMTDRNIIIDREHRGTICDEEVLVCRTDKSWDIISYVLISSLMVLLLLFISSLIRVLFLSFKNPKLY